MPSDILRYYNRVHCSTLETWRDSDMSQSLQEINQNNQFALWTKRISDCRKSGMSVSSWCSENGICKSTYYFWQKKVFTKLRNESQPEFAEVCVAAPAEITATVHLGNISVDIHSGADAETTAMLFQILHHAE